MMADMVVPRALRVSPVTSGMMTRLRVTTPRTRRGSAQEPSAGECRFEFLPVNSIVS